MDVSDVVASTLSGTGTDFPLFWCFSFSSLLIQLVLCIVKAVLLYLFRYSYFIAYYCASTELNKFMFLWHWQSNDRIWQFRKTFVTHVPWHWRSNTIYGDSGKFCHTFSVTLIIQRPYMVDFGYYRELSSHTRTCMAWCSFFIVNACKMMIQRNSCYFGTRSGSPQ